MNKLKPALLAYDVETAIAADRGDDCLVLDLASSDTGLPVPSLERLRQEIDTYVVNHNQTAVTHACKLYLVGDWVLSQDSVDEARSDERSDAAAQNTKTQEVPKEITEWHEAALKIKELFQHMGHLQELTWICGLSFTAAICEVLPQTLTKLVVDLGQPVRIDKGGDFMYRSYITPPEMKSLQQQTKLEELRLFRVHNSLQQIVWETVFRNTSEGGMRVLDLQMASAPIVRLEKWRNAKDVRGLTVPTEEPKDKEYKGMDGKGILHFSIGTGEYLDSFCIRKARIASGLVEATPLPLWCLKLDGFVLDYLPFEHELSRLVLLTCGENCIDSGLRAPKTRRAVINLWSSNVNNATSHCLIQWPNWSGIFDNEGSQRDSLGEVVAQELGLSTPLAEYASSSTVKNSSGPTELDGTALDNTMAQDYFSVSPPMLVAGADQTCPDNVSILSTRGGSEVPSPSSPTLSSPALYSPSPLIHESVATISSEISDLNLLSTDESAGA